MEEKESASIKSVVIYKSIDSPFYIADDLPDVGEMLIPLQTTLDKFCTFRTGDRWFFQDPSDERKFDVMTAIDKLGIESIFVEHDEEWCN